MAIRAHWFIFETLISMEPKCLAIKVKRGFLNDDVVQWINLKTVCTMTNHDIFILATDSLPNMGYSSNLNPFNNWIIWWSRDVLLSLMTNMKVLNTDFFSSKQLCHLSSLIKNNRKFWTNQQLIWWYAVWKVKSSLPLGQQCSPSSQHTASG